MSRCRLTREVCLASAFGLLFVGGMIYLIFRSRNILLNYLLSCLGLDPLLDGVREWGQSFVLPHWIVYSLPAGLWSISYVLIVHTFSVNHSFRTRLAFTSLMPCLGVVSELLQMVGLVPGVFDCQDVLCYAVPYLLYLSIMLFCKH